jgi:hypothetical protein
MEIDKLRRSLAHLGIPPSDYRMPKLLPLVYVAWADGKMDRVQKERIDAFAVKRYELSAAGAALIQSWVVRAPTHEYVTEGLRDVLFLAKAQDDMGVDFSELPVSFPTRKASRGPLGEGWMRRVRYPRGG